MPSNVLRAGEWGKGMWRLFSSVWVRRGAEKRLTPEHSAQLGLPSLARLYFVKHLHDWYLIFWYNLYEAGRAGITIMNIKMKKLRL